jgi:hypothetical protein
VNGAPYAPYTHVLDSELQYKGSSFSSPVFNGRVFFSDLIKQFCVNGLFSACEDDELERLDQYIRTVAVQPESVAEEAWPLIQAMASADGEAAIELLTTIGAGDHEHVRARALNLAGDKGARGMVATVEREFREVVDRLGGYIGAGHVENAPRIVETLGLMAQRNIALRYFLFRASRG